MGLRGIRNQIRELLKRPSLKLEDSGYVGPFKYAGVDFPESRNIFSDYILGAIRDGGYEQLELNQLNSIMHPNERVLEIGSGIGLISTLAAKNPLIDQVIAYEANPVLCEYQRQVHKLNNVKVDVRNSILLPNASHEQIDFYIRSDFWSSSLSSHSPYEQVVRVPVADFQQVIETDDPTLLVVDIEGGELDLFDGIDFKNIRRVLIEIHQQNIDRSGVRKIFDIFSANGFHYDQWHSTGGVIVFSHVERVNLPIT